MSKSLNAALLVSGWAYPMFYASSLPTPLRDALRATALEARRRRRGVWKVDSSMRPTLARPRDLADLAIWPKLWRRLVSYYRDSGVSDLSAFEAWMRANARDRDDPLFRCRSGELGNMHDVVEVIGRSQIRMRDRSEDLLVISEQEGTIDSASPVAVARNRISDLVIV